jgi:hypothetical protein
MEKHIIDENIGVSEFIMIEKQISLAYIFRLEFEKHLQEYKINKSDNELIFIFIFLQAYAECFLHQSMRRIIKSEFEVHRTDLYNNWIDEKGRGGERRNIQEKIEDFSRHFIIAVPSLPKNIQQLIHDININFSKLSRRRNQFLHGHAVASWSDSDGNSGASEAHSLLTDKELKLAVDEINKLGKAWNELQDSVAIEFKCINKERIKDFKFLDVILN